MKSGEQISFNKANIIMQGAGKFGRKYKKIKELGAGSFAKVFLIQNKQTRQIYACKELIKSKLSDLTKLREEINIMSKCDHPNIIKLFEVYEDSRYIELVMEQCLGGCLFDALVKKIKEKGVAFSEREAAIIFKQIMTAISYCHNQGICHRDLKMENILLLTKEKNSIIKIIDFGLSKFIKNRNINQNITSNLNFAPIKMKSILGSPHYISPEVLDGKYTQKCDIWSAGVILYVMLVGYFPFDGDSDYETYDAINEKKLDFNDKEWKYISNEAKDLIRHMICDENKRYTAERILKHPWLTKMSPNSKGAVNKINVKHLLDYKNYSNFKKFVLTYMASRLKDEEITNLEKIFLEIDTDKDGTLSFNEVKNCFLKLNKEKNLKITNKEIEEIFKSIDNNNNKRIEYTEFISAMMEQSTYCKEEKLIDIFRMLDKDGSGRISKNEIKNVLDKQGISEKDLKNFINIFDLDNDGQIDYDEFVTCMSKIEKEKEEKEKKRKK